MSMRHGISRSAVRSPSVIRRLARDTLLFVRAADRAEIAPRAGALGRRRRQEAELDGAIDDLERLEAGAAVGRR